MKQKSVCYVIVKGHVTEIEITQQSDYNIVYTPAYIEKQCAVCFGLDQNEVSFLCMEK